MFNSRAIVQLYTNSLSTIKSYQLPNIVVVFLG